MRDPPQNCTNNPAVSTSLPSSPAHRELLPGHKAHPDPIPSPLGRLPQHQLLPCRSRGRAQELLGTPQRPHPKPPGRTVVLPSPPPPCTVQKGLGYARGGAHGDRTQRVLSHRPEHRRRLSFSSAGRNFRLENKQVCYSFFFFSPKGLLLLILLLLLFFFAELFIARPLRRGLGYAIWEKKITRRSSTLRRNNTVKPRLGTRRRNASGDSSVLVFTARGAASTLLPRTVLAPTSLSLCLSPRDGPCHRCREPRRGHPSSPRAPVLHRPSVRDFQGTSWEFGRVWAPRAAELVPFLQAGLGAPVLSALAGPLHRSGARAVPPRGSPRPPSLPLLQPGPLLPPHTSSPRTSRAASIAGAAPTTGQLQPRGASGLLHPPAKRGWGWQRGKMLQSL